MERKEFFSKVLFGGSVLFIAPAVLSSCAKTPDPTPVAANQSNPMVIDLSSPSFSSLQTVGGYAYSGNIIIIRTAQASYVALSKVCTHQGCTVGFSSSANRLVCPCHGAQYNTAGSVLQGPASRALTSYSVAVNGSVLTLS